MRSKGKTILAALVAVFALGAVGVASASAALPEFVHGTGESFPIAVEYNNWHPLEEIEMGGARWSECQGLKAKGKITGAKTVSLTFESENCVQNKSTGKTCTSVGSEKGVEAFSGTGSLVYINKATKQVGVALTLSIGEINCGFPVRTKGTIAIPVTPINTKTSTLDVVIRGERSKEMPKEYENEKGEMKRAAFEFEFNHRLIFETAALTLNEGAELGLSTSKPVTINA